MASMHHGDADGNARRFAAQTSWDDTMAESMVDYLGKHPGRRIMHIAGNFHVEGDSGSPVASPAAIRHSRWRSSCRKPVTRQPRERRRCRGPHRSPAGTLAKCKK